jgi:tetratricopeptide (TPR) repeat protein
MKTLLIMAATAILMACDNSPKPVVNTNASANSAQRSERTETVTAHTTENATPPIPSNTGRTKWTQSGDPIDTKAFDTAIAAAEKNVKSKPDDKAAKDALTEAYLQRATALVGARQYAAALGDYRRALKYDPENDTANEWVNQIVGIYNGMNREAPPEGQEPPPLPFKPEKPSK